MRKQLKAINGVRKRFSGTVSKFGYKRAYAGPDIKTVCLVDIVDLDTNKVVTDHLWMPISKQLDALKLVIGDVVEFNARVAKYEKRI